MVLTALPEALRFASEYRLIIYGFIIVIVMLWRPDGLLVRTPLGAPRRLLGLTLRTARPAQGRLSGDDVLSSAAALARVPHDQATFSETS